MIQGAVEINGIKKIYLASLYSDYVGSVEHKRSRLKEKNTFSSFTNVTGKQTNPLYRSAPAEKIELTCIYYLSSSSVFLLNNQNSSTLFVEG